MLLTDHFIVHGNITPGRFNARVCHDPLQRKQVSAIHQELPAEETAKAVRRNEFTRNARRFGVKFEALSKMIGFQGLAVIRQENVVGVEITLVLIDQPQDLAQHVDRDGNHAGLAVFVHPAGQMHASGFGIDILCFQPQCFVNPETAVGKEHHQGSIPKSRIGRGVWSGKQS